MATNPELDRLTTDGAAWKRWGPYLSDRSRGTVREDDSSDGNAWKCFPHDHARARAYRWGEDGIGGISDVDQRLCFALTLWNGKDPIQTGRTGLVAALIQEMGAADAGPIVSGGKTAPIKPAIVGASAKNEKTAGTCRSNLKMCPHQPRPNPPSRPANENPDAGRGRVAPKRWGAPQRTEPVRSIAPVRFFALATPA